MVPRLLLLGLLGGCKAEDPVDPCADALVPMVLVPAGTFIMGVPEDEVGVSDRELREQHQHEVTLTRDLCIGATELTQAQYSELAGGNPSHHSDCTDCPVEDLSWIEAVELANLASDAAGLDRCMACDEEDCWPLDDDPYSCRGYRLPSQAEWQYSARGGIEERAFPNGGGLVPGTAETDCEGQLELDNGLILDDFAWYCGNGTETHPVGQLARNGYGLYDTSGNVGEFCADDYEEFPLSAQVDPWVDLEIRTSKAVSGGGAYPSGPTAMRISFINVTDWWRSSKAVGLRLAVSADALEER